MRNPSLKQRKPGVRQYSNKGQGPRSNLHANNNDKNQDTFPAWAWLFLGVALLLGFILIDHITHESMHRKINSASNADLNYGIANSNEAGKDKIMIDPLEENRLVYTDPTNIAGDGTRYHLIFSTDCSEFQHWQSYLLFHTAFKVKQPGTVTRIASGCNDIEGYKARAWHKEHVADAMSKNFLLHLTPHFSGLKDKDGNTVGDYKFFNKPFGLKHWMENAIGFEETGSKKMKNEDDVVILIDPDMILMKPITGDFSDDRDTVIGKRHQENRKFKVAHGTPFAQTYGLGTQWRTFNLHEIAGPDSPAKKVSQKDGGAFYPVGPPYIGTVRDMHAISEKWTEFVPRVHKEYPYLLAEMYAFCIAAAHLQLPHQLIDSLMISNTGAGGEGWPLIDKLPHEELCEFAQKPDNAVHALPSVFHLCQRYSVGEWFFSKRLMSKNFFECESPLMETPPSNVVMESKFKIPPGGLKKEIDLKQSQREGFMVCGIIGALNEAGKYFKDHHCEVGNMEKTLNLNKTHKYTSKK